MVEALNLSLPQKAILTSSQQVNLFLAGQGAGKTHLAGVLSGVLISSFPSAIGIVAANTYDQLNRSTMFRIREVWASYFGIKEYSEKNPSGQYVVNKQPPEHFDTKGHNFDRYNNIVSFINGAIIFTGSLDNYKALDGQEVTWAWLDETKDTKEEAVKEVITGRLRKPAMWIDDKGTLNGSGRGVSWNPLFISTSPAKVQWINEWFELDKFEQDIKRKIFKKNDFFCQDVGNKRVTISSTYHNAENLPDNYIQNQLDNLYPELQEMLIFGSPFSRSGGEFYKEFNRDKHIKEVSYDPEQPLHISFDENVHPYLTCTVWQINDKQAIQVDELCAESPNNTVRGVCDLFKRRFPNVESGLFIYGDRTSKKEDTKLEKGMDFFRLIAANLKEYKPSMRIPSSNPSVIMRGNFVNTILYNQHEGIEILISPNCSNTIADLTYLKEAHDGKKLKEKVKDKDTGVTYEKYGHTSDCLDYLICEVFKKQYKSYIRGGKRKDYTVKARPMRKNTRY